MTTALEKIGQLVGKKEFLLGGTSGALQTDFPTCVTQVYGQDKAAMVYRGRLRGASRPSESGAKVGEDAKFFPFPKAGDTAPVVLGGDVAVALKDSQGAMALLQFLASKEGGEIWAKLPGYLSPNKQRLARQLPGRADQAARPRRSSPPATRSATTCPTWPRAPSAAPTARASGRSCRTSCATRPTSRAPRSKLEAEAKKAWK